MAIETFTRMDQSTAEQWAEIDRLAAKDQGRTIEAVLDMMRALEGVNNGFAVDQLVHCLQTATRAERAGADDEMIAAALVHDMGKVVSVANHAEIASALLRPFVREDVRWVVQVHQDFEARHYYQFYDQDPDARERYRGHPAYALAEQFADEWDQCSFDPDYDTLPLSHFEPLIRDIFGRKPTLL